MRPFSSRKAMEKAAAEPVWPPTVKMGKPLFKFKTKKRPARQAMTTLASSGSAGIIRNSIHESAAMNETLFDTLRNPVPGSPVVGSFEGYRGIRLRYAVFRAEQSVAKGTVVLLHGRNESIEKYFETIRELNARGLWVATFDYRGQGGSDRILKNCRTGHVDRFSHYIRDLELFLEHIVLPDTRLPFFLLAHSTGGLIALSAAPRLANRIDRMVLTAPFVGLGKQPISPRRLYWLTTLMSITGFGRRALLKDGPEPPFEGNPLTSDVDRFRRNRGIIESHPELAVGPPSARWIFECLKAIRRVSEPRHLYSIAIPTVMISPTRDDVVSYDAQERMSQYFRACQFVPVAGSRHEILHEANLYRLQAMAAINAFLPGSDTEDSASATLEGSGA